MVFGVCTTAMYLYNKNNSFSCVLCDIILVKNYKSNNGIFNYKSSQLNIKWNKINLYVPLYNYTTIYCSVCV